MGLFGCMVCPVEGLLGLQMIAWGALGYVAYLVLNGIVPTTILVSVLG